MEAGLDHDLLSSLFCCPNLQRSSPPATVTFLRQFSFSKATSPKAEADLETIAPVILGTFLKC